MNEVSLSFFCRYVGGFTKKMRVCKLRHSSSGQDMYILTAENCENFAARGRIGEEFNFYVANNEKSRYSTSRYWESFEKNLCYFVIFSEAVTEKDKVALQFWIVSNLLRQLYYLVEGRDKINKPWISWIFLSPNNWCLSSVSSPLKRYYSPSIQCFLC